MATARFQWSEVGGQRLMDRITTARVELWVTVLCLNVALAGMFVMATTALGSVTMMSWWTCWLVGSILLSPFTGRRLCQALAPLFWLPASTQGTHPDHSHPAHKHMPEATATNALPCAGMEKRAQHLGMGTSVQWPHAALFRPPPWARFFPHTS